MHLDKENHRVITDKYEIYWFDKEIVYIRVYEDKEVDIHDVTAIIEFQQDQDVSTEHYRLVHAEEHSGISKEAREYLQETAPTVKAEAYVLLSLAQKIIFNLYVKLRRNNNPVKAFNNPEDAIEWLKSQ